MGGSRRLDCLVGMFWLRRASQKKKLTERMIKVKGDRS